MNSTDAVNQKIKTKELSNNTSSVPSKPKFDLSPLERGFKYFGAGAAYNIIVSKITDPLLNQGMDFCPTFPRPLYTYVRNVCLVREKLPGLTGTYDTIAFKMPIVEELLFRVGLQEMLLKKIPKAVLNRFAPSYSSIVDTQIAKCARVAISATAFSLAHAMPPEMGWPNCSTVRLINTFVLGLILGGVQEVTESPLMAMLLHSGYNLQGAFFIENARIPILCPPA